jgi:hypothetical protein
MKKNVVFMIAIILVLCCEIATYIVKYQDSFWLSNLRILSVMVLGVWYYENQKKGFYNTQKAFLLSLLLPALVSLSTFYIAEKPAILINISLNMFVLGLWCYCFKSMGATIIAKDSNQTLSKLTPAYFIIPILFYFFVLFPSLPPIYAIIVLLYIILFSYTGVLAAFLPINDEKKIWISVAIVLLVLANIINAYHTFLEKINYAYLLIRPITLIAKCMLVYGMIDYKTPYQNRFS